jgi:HB1, ASXL, restriction endonuclease HTH domain
MNYVEAASKILKDAGVPLHFREITKRVIDQNLVEVQGQTPWNSLNGSLRRYIRSQGKEALVVSLGEGKFGLREWGLPGEEILTDEDEGEVPGNITISPRIGQEPTFGWRSLLAKGVRSARQMATLLVPVAPEYKPLHMTLSSLFGSGLFSILYGLGLSSGNKPASRGLSNQMLLWGIGESAAAAVGLQQLTEAEHDVVAGKLSMRKVQTQITAFERLLGYGTAVGATAFVLGLALRLGAPANTRTKGAASGLMTHGLLLGLLAWRTSKRVRKNPTLT